MNSKLTHVPMNSYLKNRAALSVSRRVDEVLDQELLYQLMSISIESTREDLEILSHLKKVDLTRVFKESSGLNCSFNCSFFIEREAWISKSEQGDYRYYSKLDESLYSLDIIDLLMIFRNETLKSTFTFIQNRWELDGLTEWYLTQKKKHQKNSSLIKSTKRDSETYPSLNKLLAKNWEFLEVINDYALEKTANEELAVGEKAVFFFSGNYLRKEHFPEKSLSTVNNLVNMLCLLGFIEKIPLHAIPQKMFRKLKVIHKQSKLKNHTSYYCIASFPQILEEAEKRATLLLSEGIYYHKLTKNIVMELFGEDVHNQIYIQRTTGRKAKEEPVYFSGQNESYTEHERINRKFKECIEKYGMCEKTKLKEYSLLSRDKFNRAWKRTVEKNDCMEKYPTKEEMEAFNMKTRKVVACPR